ncbi:MAG: hypothetical protein AAF203_06185 [Pseudomonadota bacterium]
MSRIYKTLFSLSVFTILLGLGSCHSGWDKDPFVDESENIKKAVPQGVTQDVVPPLQSVMFIRTGQEHYVVNEGRKITITIEPELTHPGFVPQGIEIKDLEQTLPGAVFDPQTNTVTYEAKDVPEGALVKRQSVKISFFAEYEGLLHERKKEVNVLVVRQNTNKPDIERVEGFNTDIVEGNWTRVRVYVRDVDSPQGPILTFRGSGTDNGAPYIEMDEFPRRVSGDPTLWYFSGYIDLRPQGADITKTAKNLRVTMTAYSFFGVPSNAEVTEYSILSNAKKPVILTEDDVEFKVGEDNKHSFVVFDSKSEGQVTATCGPAFGVGASCDCQSIAPTAQRCLVQWSPSLPGRFPIRVNSKNTVNGSTNPIEATQSKTFYINVVNGGV